MPSPQPFQPLTGSTTGLTIAVQGSAASNPGTLDNTGRFATTIMVVNNIAAGTPVWIRMSAEATPVATSSDILIPPQVPVIFANPVPGGKLGLAVIANATGNSVYFTPGNGGLL
jgi:hypothetical protein